MTKHNVQKRHTALISLFFIIGLALPGSAGDEDIFSALVPPNVVLMMDNSGSMNTIMEHPAFDAASFVSTCSPFPAPVPGWTTLVDQQTPPQTLNVFCWTPTSCTYLIDPNDAGWVATPDPTDHVSNGYITRRFCNQTRRLYTDGDVWARSATWTRYDPAYMDFLFSIDDSDGVTTYGTAPGPVGTASQVLAEIDLGNNGQKYITGELFPLYKIARITAARDIAADVIYQTNSDCPAFAGACGTYEDRVRFGVAQFRNDAVGGFVRAEVDAYSNNRLDLNAAINALTAQTATPLSETLFKLYTYFMSRTTSDRPFGQDGTTRFPRYQYRESDGAYVAFPSASIPADPVTEACQKNFVILVTDGEPTNDDFTNHPTDTNQSLGFSNFAPNLIGDFAPDLPASPLIPETGAPPWQNAGSGYLDDIARFMQTTDCRPDHPGQVNNVDVYTVGFTTTGIVNDLLRATATEGNGLFFSGNQAQELTDALVSSIQDIISKSQGFSAATVPAARTADGGNLYTTLFQPTSARPFWPGLLRSYQITAAGEILDRNGACALTNLVNPPLCLGGTFKTEALAPPFWNASLEMPVANSRFLRVSIRDGSDQDVELFDHGVSSSDLGGGLGSVSDYPVSPNVSSTSDLDEAIVAFTAGCEWGSGMSSGGGNTFSGCIDRTRFEDSIVVPDRLGDIFHSNPVVVGPPASYINEASYESFASDTTYSHRDRVIFVGANDGFLHGFDAGSYDTIAGTYDEGTGAEVFGFMPWGARSKIPNIAKGDATLHTLSVDGSPAVADVWIDSDSNPNNPKSQSEWSTILITGMREGAEHYLAMDVSDPASTNYPQYLWEFPKEGDSTWRSMIGQTWSEPVITRIRLDDGGGNISEKWVAVIGFGYDPTSDPNDTAQYDPLSLKGRGIMMIDIETGRPVAVRRFGTGVGEVPDMLYAMPSTPGVLDYDGDGFADLIYIGDLGGNVWKWMIRSAGTANPSTSQLFQMNWPFRKFFSDDPTRSAGSRARSFYYSPAATLQNGILHLGIGSGERSSLNCSSTLGGCTLRNRFYLLKDRDVWDYASPTTIDGRDTLSSGDLTDVTVFEDSCPAVQPRGYFFTLDDGEKFVTNCEVFNSFFFLSTFTPDISNACEPEGNSSLYGFLAKCGQGFFGPPGPTSPIAGSDRVMDIGKGLPTDARISVAPGSGGNRLIISKQDGRIINIESGEPDEAHGVLYWRESN